MTIWRLGASAMLLIGASMPCWVAHAQPNWRRVPVPAYQPAQFVAGQWQFWYRARADDFVTAVAALQAALGDDCRSRPDVVQRAWRDAVLSWARLSASPIGPLVDRRSGRRIDFLPIRPHRIEEALGAVEPDMERIGSAAKGFGALEWLLWRRTGDSRGCAYAIRVASEIGDEARSLQAGFAGAPPGDADPERLQIALSETANQLVGGLDQLRMQWIVRPAGEATQRGGPPVYPRPLADAGDKPPTASTVERLARWSALRELMLAGAAAPAPGAGLISIESYLRGKGLNALADRLVQTAATADDSLRSASTNPARLDRAAADLATLKHLMEIEILPVLGVRAGFSDADGD